MYIEEEVKKDLQLYKSIKPKNRKIILFKEVFFKDKIFVKNHFDNKKYIIKSKISDDELFENLCQSNLFFAFGYLEKNIFLVKKIYPLTLNFEEFLSLCNLKFGKFDYYFLYNKKEVLEFLYRVEKITGDFFVNYYLKDNFVYTLPISNSKIISQRVYLCLKNILDFDLKLIYKNPKITYDYVLQDSVDVDNFEKVPVIKFLNKEFEGDRKSMRLENFIISTRPVLKDTLKNTYFKIIKNYMSLKDDFFDNPVKVNFKELLQIVFFELNYYTNINQILKRFAINIKDKIKLYYLKKLYHHHFLDEICILFGFLEKHESYYKLTEFSKANRNIIMQYVQNIENF